MPTRSARKTKTKMTYPALINVQAPVPQPKEGPSFFDLPAELRNMVYDSAFEDIEEPEDLALLLTCRQVYMEAAQMAYDRVPILVLLDRKVYQAASLHTRQALYGTATSQSFELASRAIGLPDDMDQRRSIDTLVTHDSWDSISLLRDLLDAMPRKITIRGRRMNKVFGWLIEVLERGSFHRALRDDINEVDGHFGQDWELVAWDLSEDILHGITELRRSHTMEQELTTVIRLHVPRRMSVWDMMRRRNEKRFSFRAEHRSQHRASCTPSVEDFLVNHKMTQRIESQLVRSSVAFDHTLKLCLLED